MNKKYFKIIIVAFLFIVYLQWFRNDIFFLFIIDHVNLAFHEAGHIFLSFFGETIHYLGGTISQLFFPALCAFHLLKQENNFGFQLCIWWFGENLLNISIYIKDAIKQQLPLVGGGDHDWTFLLGKFHLLPQCEIIGSIVFFAGSLIIFYSFYLILKDAIQTKS